MNRARLKLLLATMARAWARAVIAIVCSSLLLNAVGLSEVSGYATITGIYMALSPPAGSRARRVQTVVAATLVIAVMSVLGAELTRWTAAVALSLALAGFVAGLLPRLGGMAASMQMPLLISFAYSVGQPLSDAAALDRGLAVLLSMPIFVVSTALAFQVDQRRPLVLGSAQALGALATALGHAATGTRAEAEAALAHFRAAMTRLRDSALPLGGSREDQAGLALVGAVQESIVAAKLLDDMPGTARRGDWLATLAMSAGETAASLARHGGAPRPAADADSAPRAAAAGHGGAPPPAVEPDSVARATAADHTGAPPPAADADSAPRAAAAGPDGAPSPPAAGPSPELVAAAARRDDDHAVWLLADALAAAAAATAVLSGRPGATLPGSALGRLPSPWRRLRATLDAEDPIFRRAVRLGLAAGLAGLAARLLDLGRAYWPVFSVIVILSGPAARDWKRALQRLGGTVLGLFLALALIQLVGTSHTLATGLGLFLLLPGLVLMPINYGAAMIFVTATVGLLYASGGTEDDFLSYRVEDTFIGAAIAAGVGLLVWHTKQRDWWLAASRMARSLADAVSSAEPAQSRDTLVMRALALRTETLEAAELHSARPEFGAAWLYTAAAEELVQTLTGPRAERPEDPEALAARLRAIAAGTPPEPLRSTSAAAQEVSELATALKTLKTLDPA